MPDKLKQIFIIGHKIENDKIEEIKKIYSDKELLIIDNRKKEYTKDVLPLYDERIDFNTRIDINAHGIVKNNKHYINIEESIQPTTNYLSFLGSIVSSPLYIHLISCFGGAASKDVIFLPDGSVLTTHTESEHESSVSLSFYSFIAIAKKNKEYSNKFQGFLDNIHTESIQSATFNIKLSNKIENFTINPSINDIQSFHTVKTFLDMQALKFSKWYDSLANKYHQDYPEIFRLDTLRLPSIQENEIDEFLLGNFIYNSMKGSQEFIKFLKNTNNKYILENVEHFLNTKVFSITPLFIASQEGHKEIVEVLLEHNANPDLGFLSEATPLFIASQNGHKEIVQSLLQHKADPNLSNNQGASPLYAASQNGHAEIVEVLLQHKADPDLGLLSGDTPLFIASYTGYKDIVEVLLQYRANSEIGNESGSTPLCIASQEGHKEIVEALLQYKANPNLGDNQGFTPLFIASQMGHTDIAETLLQHKAKPNLGNESGRTPLFIASQMGHTDIAETLLQHKADPNLGDNQGFTPLFIASQMGHINIVETLLQYKADPNLSNHQGSSPLLVSSFKSNMEITKTLIDNGANINIAKELAIEHKLIGVEEFLDMLNSSPSLQKPNHTAAGLTDLIGEGNFDNYHDEL